MAGPARLTTPFLISVGLLSGASLAYEILLMRLFSIIQWHHFAYMMISLALLGFGASGTFLALTRARLLRHFPVAYAVNAALFGVTALGCFLLAQRISFNALEILWDLGQWRNLAAVYCLLLLPFFFAANCICLSLAHFSEGLHRVYGADLLGAGAGALGIMALLHQVFPMPSLQIIAALGFVAAAFAWWGLSPRRAGVLVPLAGALLPFLVPAAWTELRPTQYKALSQTLATLDTRVVAERSSPLGLLTVVESPTLPFRHVPGMSLNTRVEPPEQLALFTDGDAPSVITRYDGRREALEYLDYTTSALPYHLLQRPRVLVLGAGGGSEVLQALYHDARRIEAVELNPQTVKLVRDTYGEFAGGIYSLEQVHVHVAEARGFVSAARDQFDLIQVALLDAFNTSSAGMYALNESYLYTVEAIGEYLGHLAPGGMLAVTRWVKLPPRDGPKLFGTVVRALERAGVEEPGRHLVWLRGWKTSTLLVRNEPFDEAAIEAVRRFAEERWFDAIWYPGIRAEEVNRYNRLEEPWLHQAAVALLGPERQAFLADYKFNLVPATDDRPYFFQFFKWSALPELMELRARGGMALLDLGYLVLVATLIQALVISLALVMLPLWLARRWLQSLRRGPARQWRAGLYFLAVGLGFMFVEIAYIQKFILYLSHPLYAVAVVVTGFLVFAGLGSRSLALDTGRALGPARPVAAIGALALGYVVALPWLFSATLHWPDGVKIAISLACIAPLAFFMGRPFPLGLRGIDGEAPAWLPWAWGVNGCASVLGAILATLLAVHLGVTAVIVLAVLLYALAAWSYPWRAA